MCQALSIDQAVGGSILAVKSLGSWVQIPLQGFVFDLISSSQGSARWEGQLLPFPGQKVFPALERIYLLLLF